MDDAIEYAQIRMFWFDMRADYYDRLASKEIDEYRYNHYTRMAEYERKKASYYKLYLKFISDDI